MQAFVWDQLHGMRTLADVLEGLGVSLNGWKLEEATGVSEDGLTIVLHFPRKT
jgi:hypothetical protein